MKAWIVDSNDGWIEFTYADKSHQARRQVFEEYYGGVDMNWYEYMEFRAHRCPWLDGEPRRPMKAELIEHGFTEYAEEMPDA